MVQKRVHQLFSDTAKQFAGKIAIDRGTRQITYGELEERSNRLANVLLQNGHAGMTAIVADDPIDVVTAMLGVLKAGGIFAPLDPNFPLKRLRDMAALAQPQAYICAAAYAQKAIQLEIAPGVPLIRLDEIGVADSTPSPQSTVLPVGAEDGNAPCSIYFTSGSTGRPKAILGRLSGIDHFVRWEMETVGIGVGTRVSQLASPSFDGFLKDVFVPLCGGGTVCAPESRSVVLDAGRLADWIDVEGIEVLQCVPSVFRSLLNQKLDGGYFSALKWVVLAGEALLPADVKRWMEVFGNRVQLLNLYGPTETTITKLSYLVQPEDIHRPSIPIGKPMRGSAVMVLNAARKPCPTGVAGEIYIRTPYRALGYYKDAELTGQVFLKNPFNDDPEDLVYRTGDYGRLLKDGNLEFLGRKDDQVKIRGVRVELREIENVLRGHAGVKDVAVVDREDGSGNKFLCAYVVLSEGVQGRELRECSAERLPETMVPSAFIEMKELPRTLNGKIDRKALPALQEGRRRREGRTATAVEEIIAGLWAEVLQLGDVDVEENFFELGGHSLLATQVVSRVRATLGVQVPLRALFEVPTVAGMARYVEQNNGSGRDQALAPIQKRNAAAHLPLSYAQQRLWFVQQFEPESAAYNIPFGVRLLGPLDHSATQWAFEEIVRRHEILRTTFPMVDGVAVQRVSEWRPQTDSIDLRGWPVEQREDQARCLANKEFETPFDLQNGPLLRIRLIQLDELEHVLLVTMHHIVGDAWSMEIVAKEFCLLYEARRKDLPSPLTELPIQYADYAAWQREWVSGDMLEREMDYWRRQLASYSGVVELPSDRPRHSKHGDRGGLVMRGVDVHEAENLRSFCRREGVTLFMALLAALDALLNRYTAEMDLAVGTPVANRNRVEAEGLVGAFVNTLVLRVQVEPERSFRELLKRVRETSLEAYMHQDLPFEKLVEELRPERNLSRTALFQILMVVQNAPAAGVTLQELEVQRLAMGAPPAKFELIIGIGETSEGRRTNWHYNADLFDEATILRFADQFERLIKCAMNDPDRSIRDLPLLSPEECRHIVERGNGSTHVKGKLGVHEMFEKTAKILPDASALAWNDSFWSYRQLDNRANQIAGVLREKYGVTPDTRVGICLNRGPEIVASMLGVWKAGAAYVPIDSAYPAERGAFILSDSKAVVVVAEKETADRVLAPGVPVLLLEKLQTDGSGYEKPDVSVHPDHLAYVIYTSGSAGRPKGVLVTQRGLRNYVEWASQAYEFRAGGRTPLYSSLGFDLTVTSLWPTLVSGGCVEVVPEKEGIEWLAGRGMEGKESENGKGKKGSYEVLKATPSHLRVLKEAIGEKGEEIAERLVIGGEALRWEDVNYWSSQGRGVRVVNEYGPTETVVGSCVFEVGNEREAEGAVPIGRAIANTRVYVLDRWGKLSPSGAAGELYIGGEGVARGYLGQPGLTAERFVPDEYSGREGERLYRTGDKVRWRGDGELEYLGRLDNQVKIRGYRIELGEIEAQVAGYEGVRQTAVVVREDKANEPRLVAYVSFKPGVTNGDRESLKDYLKSQLPEYMVPSAIVELAELPLTTNGKLDERALPRPETVTKRGKYVAPRTEAEQVFAGIWARVLRLSTVGVEDNFFELGGDSILCIQAVSYARDAGYYITVAQMFEYQTIAALAQHVQKGGSEPESSPAEYSEAPLTPIQQWFVEREGADLSVGNNAVFIKVPPQMPTQAVESMLQKLIAQHDALQLRFVREQNNTWKQRYSPASAEKGLLEIVDLSEEPDSVRESKCEEAVKRIQKEVDVEAGHVFRAAWINMGEGEQRFMLAIHHLVVDAVSLRILTEDIQTLCQQWQQGTALQLGPRTTSFLEWANTLQDLAGSSFLKAELPYWQENLSRPAPPIRRDHPEGQNTVGAHAYFQIQADALDTEALLRDTYRAYKIRTHEILITALARAMVRWNGRAGLLLDLEGHGRVDLGPQFKRDVSRTVGWFTTIYPVYLGVENKEIAEDLKSVKETLRQVPNQGLGFGVLQYLDESGRFLLQAAPKPEVVFNYLGQFDQTKSSHDWAFAPKSVKTTEGSSVLRPHLLEIQAYVVRGHLQVDFRYGANIQDETTVRLLASYLLEELHGLIQHCRTAETTFTPSDFPLLQLTQKELDGLQRDRKIVNLYPLSPLQQGILFHSLQAPGAGFYVNQRCITIEGPLDVKAFRRAWLEAMQRHAVLRTSFSWQDVREPVQMVESISDLCWEDLDWRRETSSRRERLLEDFLADDRKRDLNLTHAPLMRLALIRAGVDHFQLVWTHHHILLDGWSVPLILQDVMRLYVAFCSGETPDLPQRRPYSDYIEWLLQQDKGSAEAFWRDYLRAYSTPTRLQIERESPRAESGPQFVRKTRRLSAEASEKLESIKQRHHITLNTMFQAAWGFVLQRYTGQQVVVFGATSSGRPAELSGSEAMAGLFINTLPVKIEASPGARVLDLLTKLQQEQIAARRFEYSSLVQIQGVSEIPRDQPLFDNIFVFENYPVDNSVRDLKNAVRITGLRVDETTHYPLVALGLPGDQVGLQIQYDTQKIDDEKAERLLDHWARLLAAMSENPEAPSSNLEMLSPSERSQIIEIWNRTGRKYRSRKYIHSRIEQQARRTPDRVAVKFEGSSLSYGELNAQANQLAHYLRAGGVTLESRVGLCLERSTAMVVAVVAVLKAGAAYVPLEPGYPSERLAYMLKDSGLQALITARNLLHRVPETDAKVICLEEARDQIRRCSSANPVSGVDGANAAYVIYTSGSTGLPKGAINTHAGILNRILWMQEMYGLTQHDCVLQKTPFSFDVSVWEFLWPLVSGACLIVARPEGHKAPQYLNEVIEREAITVLHFVPSMLAEFLQEQTEGQSWKLRLVLSSGEELPRRIVERFLVHKPNVQLYNLYGPTEAAIDVTYYRCENQPAATRIPIGRPIANTQIYLLDAEGAPVPVGVAGGLYIGGAGVARGYLNRPQLTAERFLPDPFAKSPGARLYKTGDLGRWRDDGNIEFLGRDDFQVKIRGHRIELGEIEAVLTACPGVREAAVVTRQSRGGGLQIVAYIVASVEPKQVQREMRARLPEYMVPAVIMKLDRLPLSPNGKLDRRSLPEHGTSQSHGNAEPRGEIELQLALLFEDVLGVSPVGRDQSFFELGGHSILALSLLRSVKIQFGQSIPLPAFLQSPTIELLGTILKKEYHRSQLVPIQRRGTKKPLFFVHALGASPWLYADLARLLVRDEQPLFGFQALDDEETEAPSFLTIEQRAARYVDELQQSQAEGPYLLGGYSFGGYVAYEMARQLQERKQRVDGLFLFDLAANTPREVTSAVDDADYLVGYFKNNLPLLAGNARIGRGIELLDIKKVSGDTSAQRFQSAVDQLIQLEIFPEGTELSQVRNYVLGARLREQALCEYSLRPYAGPALLIRADDNPAIVERSPDPDDLTLGWGGLCAGRVKVGWVPGTHKTFLLPPHVEKVAEVLRSYLRTL